MSLSTQRGSTVDGSAGPIIAIGVAEVGTGILQATVGVGNKTTWAEASRTGLTGADAPTGGDMTTTGFAGSAGANLFDLENALAVQVRATCTVASATLTGRIAFYDGSNACIGVSETLSFTSDATLRLGNASGDFVCRANQLVDAAGARKARFKVDSVTTGTWAAYCRPL